MGISVLTKRAEYDLMEVFRAIAYDINDRMSTPKSPADDAIIARNEQALDKLNKCMKVYLAAGKERSALVTEFAVPTEPRLGGDPSLDVVSQILDGTMRPQLLRLTQ